MGSPGVNLLYIQKKKKALMTFTGDDQIVPKLLKNRKYTGILIPWKKVAMIAI